MKQIIFLTFFATVIAVSFSATAVDTPVQCPVLAGAAKYSYDPTTNNGPAHWGKLLPDYSTCDDGDSQSPIDLPMPTTTVGLSSGPQPRITTARMAYSAGSFNWALNCVRKGTCGSTTFRGVKYDVLNLHFHSPSEHLLNGHQYPLEAHIVHKSANGEIAVLATLFEYPTESYASHMYTSSRKEVGTNQLVKKVLASMSIAKGKANINLGGIVNPDMGYCSYTGSLTTPPCSEGVTFFMAMHIETVTRRQVAAYRLSAGVGLDGNNRPTMPLNGRDVTCYSAHRHFWKGFYHITAPAPIINTILYTLALSVGLEEIVFA